MANEQVVDSSIRSSAASYRLFDTYRSLQPGEIRLLEILPSSTGALTGFLHPRRGAGVECNVVYSHLDDNTDSKGSSVVRYDAVSYCWGNSKPTAEIVIVNHGAHRFQVTDSLLAALKQFRLTDKSRFVWLDFICINQQDQDEKAHQVARMTDIYRRAEQVLGWLGTADRAGESIYMLNQHRLGVKQELQEFNPVWMSDLSIFLSKPFFSRIWIVQEVAVAKQLSLCFGRYTISWEDFRSLLDRMLEQFGDVMNTTNTDVGLERILMLLSTRNLVSEHIAQVHARPMTLYAYQTTRMDAERAIANVEHDDHVQFVNLSRTFGSTDPRDRIFALNGLMPDQFRYVVANYDSRNTAEKVFSDFAISTMTRMQSLDILSQAGIHESNLPSWTPDYTRRLAHRPLDLRRYAANAEVFEYRKSPSTAILLVRGYKVGTIRDLEAGFLNTRDHFDDSVFAVRWRPAPSPPPERIEIFERTLTNAMSVAKPIYYAEKLKTDTTPTNYVNFGKSLVTGASALFDSARHRTPRISTELERIWYAAMLRSNGGITVPNLNAAYGEFLLGGSILPGFSPELSVKYMDLLLDIWRENIKGNPWRTRGGFGDGNEIPVEIKVAHLEAKGPPSKDSGILNRTQLERNPEVYWFGDNISDATKKIGRFIAKHGPESSSDGQKQPSEMEKKIAEYEKRPKATRRQDDQDIKKVIARMVNREVERMSQGRKLAVTSEASGVAWVPQLTQPGDQIWILVGARVPFVLRPVLEASGVYRVVGEAYHSGAMYGEYFSREGLQPDDGLTDGSSPPLQQEDLSLI